MQFRKFFFVPGLVFLFGCNPSAKSDQPARTVTSAVDESGNDVDKSLYYAGTDTVIIASEYFDTIGYSKKAFDAIIDQYNYLLQEFPDPPDVSWAKDMAVALKTVKDNDAGFLDFSSEAGQDSYYILYAHFLMRRDSSRTLIARRAVLNKIYQAMNDMADEIARGGTFYGHQYQRIAGCAEYAVNMFAIDSVSFLQSYDIGKQKALFIAALKQAATDQLSIDTDSQNAVDKAAWKAKIFAAIDRIEEDITDGFYLYYARQFYYNHY